VCRFRDIDNDNVVTWMEWMETKAFLILDMNNQLQRALTENETIALKALFDSLDGDNDGVITQDEAREYYKIKVEQMIAVGMVPPLDYYAKQEYVLNKVEHFFRFHDRDSSNEITNEEFNAEESKFVLMDRFRKQAHVAHGSVLKFEKDLQTSADMEKQPLVLDKHTMEHAKLIFDESNDGKGMSFEDLKKGLKGLKIRNVSAKQLKAVRKKVFKEADRDGSRMLDFHEFLAVYSFFHVREFDFDVFLEASDGIGVDEDGDGVVDTYLLNNAQTERYMTGVKNLRLSELELEYDGARTDRSSYSLDDGASTNRTQFSTQFTPRTGQVL